MHTPPPLCLPKFHPQDTPQKCWRRDALKFEESYVHDFFENHITPLSTAFDRLAGDAGTVITRFKACASQPISDLKAAAAAAMRDAGAAVASAQRDMDNTMATAFEIAAVAEEKAIHKAAAAAAEAKSATAAEVAAGQCCRRHEGCPFGSEEQNGCG